MKGPYDDIIHLPHPTSHRHPRMPVSDRAAQFSPFAALSGHGSAIAETARVTRERMELDEDAREQLDQKLMSSRRSPLHGFRRMRKRPGVNTVLPRENSRGSIPRRAGLF